MGQLLHGSARTTAAVHHAIQQRQESLATLAMRSDVNPKTVAKGKKRSHVHDAPLGPKPCHSAVLTPEEEALIGALRRHPLLPLDDCLCALQATPPHLSRSALHRCLQRHGISCLPETGGEQPAKKRFKPYAIGYLQIGIAEAHTEERKFSLFAAIDRACTWAYAELHAEANKIVAAQCLRHMTAAIPAKIPTVLTNHGRPFTNRKRHVYALEHLFDRVCQESGLDHRLTNAHHLTNPHHP